MNNLWQAILKALQHSDRLTPSELHRRLGGHYTTQNIEAEMIAMDLDGVIRNDLVPMAKITEKGRKERGAAHAG